MILIQIVGLIALILGVVSVQFKHRRNILLVQLSASVTWIIHFLLLGATSGAVMNAVGALRTYSYYVCRSEPRPSWLPWSIAVLAAIVTVATWQGMLSLLPLSAMLLAIYALWQKSEQKIRFYLTLCVPLWFAYNLTVMSYAGMASDLLALISGVIALYRYRKQDSGLSVRSLFS